MIEKKRERTRKNRILEGKPEIEEGWEVATGE